MKNFVTKKFSAALLCLPLCGLPLSLTAEETEKKQEKEVQQVQKQTVATAKPTKKSNADDYQATEEISEDLSVSYPVDI
jgi:hypothetical protein